MRARLLNPRRILMTTDAVGGVFTYAIDLAAGLGDLGIDVTLAVSGPAPSPAQRIAASEAGASLVEIDAALDWTARNDAEMQASAERFAQVVTELRPDLVHLNSSSLAGYGTVEGPLLGVCHSCLATWWEAVGTGQRPKDFAWRIRAATRGYAACGALVAPTRAFAAATMRAYGIPAPAVIHNGRRGAAAYGTDAREPIVLTVGRLWDEGKDARTLDRAAAQLDVPFVALGPTEAPDGQAQRFDALRTPGAVPPAEVERWMRRAPVFASAARYEPFGLAVLEAASAGCALVLSDIPSFRELWDGAACFVSVGDADGFATTIQNFLTSPSSRVEASHAARRRAERYGIAPMAEAYLGVYRTLMERGIAP